MDTDEYQRAGARGAATRVRGTGTCRAIGSRDPQGTRRPAVFTAIVGAVERVARRANPGTRWAERVGGGYHGVSHDHDSSPNIVEPAPTLVLMAGAPGAGKTTLALAVGRALGWPVVDKDTLKSVLLTAAIANEVAGATSYRLLYAL